MSASAIEVEGVSKSFGTTHALAGVSLRAEEGQVLGLLGPNGAGKSTLVRILSTLLRPDSGLARVAGFDVVRDARALRSHIGLAGQSAAVDALLTGRENLELVGRLYHLGPGERRRRAQETLERFGLTAAGDRLARTYSGGMRRRLDLAASLVGRPAVLILDEPTTGLDPRTRADLWRYIEDLVAEGTTVLLTTQYLEEADRLAHRIVVIDGGRVIAEGTSSQLKAQTGDSLLYIQITHDADLDRAAAMISQAVGTPANVERESRQITIPLRTGPGGLIRAGRLLEDNGVAMDDLAIRRPSLDDVFLTLTGRAADHEAPAPDDERELVR
jgi:ABC-2 type transport system ATP-binding protein